MRYYSNSNGSYTISKTRNQLRNLHLVIISNPCYSNGTQPILPLHGMQGASGSSPLGSKRLLAKYTKLI